ncbi:MAG TPA: 30S ribosomal protein S17 [bacterium]|uniref:Small ribosomal subunit protein uS17 n=1 Tax=candidate division TA06 bacterium ADurb.Bin417 TaxID=1852828 RepID=A0A1V5MHY0_UNCT6|nr:MAG: 30S ribosomal protein S17 [candidate division TA06 bacterium ADurb.Bin417]HNQ35340.1 30S ribosomal protein S17 [bacterium]HNS49289.1 30S ribosomal protein S17 [bacterium]
MKRQESGTVVSDRMDKTRVVVVERLIRHPLYQREMRRRTRYKVHDPKNESHTGDRVLIEEFRPISRDKSWRLLSIIKKGSE